jgi:mitochondrial fission protein ELM1
MTDTSMDHIRDQATAAPAVAGGTPPRVWLVSGYRAGERTQMLALAEALGWPFVVKNLKLRFWDFVPGLLRKSTLDGIDRRHSSRLEAPWPDLVISAGMRNEPVARWIRDQSGGRCRLVHVGRPWAAFEQFDLIITTPQYRLPERNNILHNTGTMHGVNPASLAAAAARWAPEFSHLPRPFTGLLVGGDSGPYTLGRKTAARLGTEASQLAGCKGGSLLITTSARTSTLATDALADALDCPSYIYRWAPNPDLNPYLGILAVADQLVVTNDSVSMLSEAVATGKPVYMFDLAKRGDFRLGAAIYRWLMRHGHPRLTRDLDLFHRRLVDSGRVVRMGNARAGNSGGSLDDLGRAVERVKGLMANQCVGAARDRA